MRETLQSAAVAFILNKTFNFSRMVFNHMAENIKDKKGKFLMYPRFVQMIIDDKLPNLVKAADDILPMEHMTDTTLSRIKSYRGKSVKPPEKNLFGHLINPCYIAPPGRLWRNFDSDSDDEGLVIPDEFDSEKRSSDESSDSDSDNDDQPGSFTVAAAEKSSKSGKQPIEQQTEDIEVELTDSEETASEKEERVQKGSKLVLAPNPEKEKKRKEAWELQDDPIFNPESSAPAAEKKKIKKRKGKEVVESPKKSKKRRKLQLVLTKEKQQSSSKVSKKDSKKEKNKDKAVATSSTTPKASKSSKTTTVTIPTISLINRYMQKQIDELNSLVKKLIEKNKQDNLQSQRSILALQTTVHQHTEQIVKLEEDNLELQTKLNELTGGVPKIQEGGDDDDSSSSSSSDSKSNKEDDSDGDESDKEDDADDDSDNEQSSDDVDDDDDDDDDDGNVGAAATETKKSDSGKQEQAERRTKRKQEQPKGQSSSVAPVQEPEDNDPDPINRNIPQNVLFMDPSGIVQGWKDIDEEIEEGEIIHSLTKEQIAEIFQLNPDEVIIDQPTVNTSEIPDMPEDAEVEEVTDEDIPQYVNPDGSTLPSFEELFAKAAHDVLGRASTKQSSQTTSEPTVEDQKLKPEWEHYMKGLKRKVKAEQDKARHD
ncbi:MAG: hypothetical protein Q8874_02520, partial [Sweet potato little leaf phytoplasma]|nr:hypothetical protein [Sweet potato little leaf phytoplasma]